MFLNVGIAVKLPPPLVAPIVLAGVVTVPLKVLGSAKPLTNIPASNCRFVAVFAVNPFKTFAINSHSFYKILLIILM